MEPPSEKRRRRGENEGLSKIVVSLKRVMSGDGKAVGMFACSILQDGIAVEEPIEGLDSEVRTFTKRICTETPSNDHRNVRDNLHGLSNYD